MCDVAAPPEQPLHEAVPSPLSSRDRELLRHLASGKSTAQLASALAVTTNTVRTRLRRVQGKLDARGRDQLVRRGREIGVIDAPAG